jgi:hypothetical protein
VKLSIVDVKRREVGGATFVVEMQVLPITGFLNRVPAITSDTVTTPSSPRVRATGSRRLGHDFEA